MKLSAILEPLVAAGVDAATILLAVKAWEDQQEDALQQRRAADAERQARKRERDKSRDITLHHSDGSLVRDRVAPVDDKPITTDTSSSKNTTAARDLAEFRAALAPLDDVRLTGLIKVRRAKKAPLTGHAAGLFLKAISLCGLSLPDAADICIERNWLTIKPDWLNKPQARGSPPQQQAPQMADVFQFIGKNFSNDPGSEHDDSRSARQALSYLPAGGSQR